MPKILTQYLPEEQKKRLHTDFLKNEQQYWQMRDQLLKQYQGKWVAYQLIKRSHRSKRYNLGLPRVCGDQWVALSGPHSSHKRRVSFET